MASPARMTRPPGLTAYLARPPRQPSVSPPKRRPGRPEPSTPLASNEKPMQNPSTSCRPKPPTRQRSSCKSGRTGVAGPGQLSSTFECIISLEICAVRPIVWPDPRGGVSVSDRERPLRTGFNAPLMARLPSSDLRVHRA